MQWTLQAHTQSMHVRHFWIHFDLLRSEFSTLRVPDRRHFPADSARPVHRPPFGSLSRGWSEKGIKNHKEKKKKKKKDERDKECRTTIRNSSSSTLQDQASIDHLFFLPPLPPTDESWKASYIIFVVQTVRQVSRIKDQHYYLLFRSRSILSDSANEPNPTWN